MAASIIAIVNGKGGCGKTSCASNLAVIWSTQGQRVLALDLDAQGNLAVDLGVEDTDAGLAFSLAIQGGTPVTPITDVRPGLDLVPAGVRTDQLAAALSAQAHRDPAAAIHDIVDTVHALAGAYDLTVIDTAPAGGLLEDAALVAADWILVPTKPDDKSLLGLSRVSQRLSALSRQNLPTGELVGVVLFAISSTATRIRKQSRRELLEAFAAQPVVFDAIIRASERGAIDQSRHGLVALEYAHAARGTRRFAAGARTLADDYLALADEIRQRITTPGATAPATS